MSSSVPLHIAGTGRMIFTLVTSVSYSLVLRLLVFLKVNMAVFGQGEMLGLVVL